jgi:hypothetical protein
MLAAFRGLVQIMPQSIVDWRWYLKINDRTPLDPLTCFLFHVDRQGNELDA